MLYLPAVAIAPLHVRHASLNKPIVRGTTITAKYLPMGDTPLQTLLGFTLNCLVAVHTLSFEFNSHAH